MLDLKKLCTTETMPLEYHDVLEIARKKMNVNDDMYVRNLEIVRKLLKPESLAHIIKDYMDDNPGDQIMPTIFRANSGKQAEKIVDTIQQTIRLPPEISLHALGSGDIFVSVDV
jgi:hypothetical protein